MTVGVTMRDVAREAGVSVATVSRALSGSAVVAPEVRERVLSTAEAMNYVGSRLPANLRARSSLILSLVVGNVRNPYFPDLIAGCEDAAQRAGYALVFGDSDEDPDRESAVLKQMAVERVAGIVLAAAAGSNEGLRLAQAAEIPIVAVDRRMPNQRVDTVTVDNAAAVFAGTQHLIELGHRRIAMVSGPQHVSTAKERQAGYLRGLESAGMSADSALLAIGDFRVGTARTLVSDLLALAEPPTAIITVNNLATVGTLQALREAGLRVPRDVSVLGFDDLLAGEFMDPPLTAIAQPTYEVGRKAIELLARRISEPTAPIEDVVLKTELLVRGSTGPVPRASGGKPSRKHTLSPGRAGPGPGERR